MSRARFAPSIVLGMCALTLGLTPLSAFAASSKPTCTLTATTHTGSVQIKSSDSIIVTPNDVLTLAWTSEHAQKGTDSNGDSIALNGSSSSTPKGTKTYTYTFKNGSKKAVCKLSVSVASAEIDTSSLSVDSGKKATISGTANGTKAVRVTLVPTGTKKLSYDSKATKLSGGKWTVKVPSVLPDGSYTVTVYADGKAKLNVLAERTLNVGLPPAFLKVSSIPLLTGGTVRAGQTVPVSYLQLLNTGDIAVNVTGFTLKENGSAPDQAVIGLSTVDDKGGSKGSVGGIEGTTPFKNGLASVPTIATILPKQMKLFTIKAQLGANAGSFAGTALALDVASVEAVANITAAFPIRGTTWTITR